jgi:hypothetical protein
VSYSPRAGWRRRSPEREQSRRRLVSEQKPQARAAMPLFRRKPIAHRVVVHQLGKEQEDRPSFWALCDCGWNTLPRATREEAFADAYGHDPNVAAEVELGEEGGVGWICLFCGAVIGEAPIRLSASWTEDGEEQEQWFAAHRECLIQHASDDESIRGGPLFDP